MKTAVWALSLLPALGATLVLAAAPAATPRLPGGHPDLNGTWENGGGIDFLKPQRLADGSVCVSGCPDADPAATPGAARPRPPPDRPRYKPEYQARSLSWPPSR